MGSSCEKRAQRQARVAEAAIHTREAGGWGGIWRTDLNMERSIASDSAMPALSREVRLARARVCSSHSSAVPVRSWRAFVACLVGAGSLAACAPSADSAVNDRAATSLRRRRICAIAATMLRSCSAASNASAWVEEPPTGELAFPIVEDLRALEPKLPTLETPDMSIVAAIRRSAKKI